MPTADAEVARWARRQHGLVTRQQAAATGLTDGAVRHRVATGRWVAADAGVYRLAGVPVTWQSVLLAHVLAAGPGAVASHRSAAVLWGLDGVRRGAPELTTARARHYVVPPGVRVHRSTDLGRVTPTARDGVPVTPVARTLLDLGAVVPDGVLHAAVDDARRRALADWDDLVDVLVRHARRGRRGAGPLRRLLEGHAHEMVATGSRFERLVIGVLVTAGLPAPELQFPVAVGGRSYRIDLAYPHARLGIELDGGDHLRRRVWEDDHVRQNALVLAGWTVLRFTWRDYRWRRATLVAEVGRALAAAA